MENMMHPESSESLQQQATIDGSQLVISFTLIIGGTFLILVALSGLAYCCWCVIFKTTDCFARRNSKGHNCCKACIISLEGNVICSGYDEPEKKAKKEQEFMKEYVVKNHIIRLQFS